MVRRRSANAVYQQRLRNLAKARAARRAIHGGSFFGSLKSGLSKANNFLREGKYISRGLKAVSSALPPQYGAYASQFGDAAEKLGYGRRRRTVRRRTVRSIAPVAKVRSHYRVTGSGVTRVRAHYRMM